MPILAREQMLLCICIAPQMAVSLVLVFTSTVGHRSAPCLSFGLLLKSSLPYGGGGGRGGICDGETGSIAQLNPCFLLRFQLPC